MYSSRLRQENIARHAIEQVANGTLGHFGGRNRSSLLTFYPFLFGSARRAIHSDGSWITIFGIYDELICGLHAQPVEPSDFEFNGVLTTEGLAKSFVFNLITNCDVGIHVKHLIGKTWFLRVRVQNSPRFGSKG